MMVGLIVFRMRMHVIDGLFYMAVVMGSDVELTSEKKAFLAWHHLSGRYCLIVMAYSEQSALEQNASQTPLHLRQ